MFNNPFTPDSQKARKSLFKKTSGFSDRILSDKIKKEIESIESAETNDRVVDYFGKEMKNSQAKFLNDISRANYNLLQMQKHMSLAEFIKITLSPIIKNDSKMFDKKGNILSFKLSQNIFGNLPETIKNLKRLNYLTLTDCKQLPGELDVLPNLMELDLSNNRIDWSNKDDFVEKIKKCKKLKAIHLLNTGFNDETLNWLEKQLPHIKFLL